MHLEKISAIFRAITLILVSGGIKFNRQKKTIYTKGKSIDGQTHYGENVLLTYLPLSKQELLRQRELYNSSVLLVLS